MNRRDLLKVASLMAMRPVLVFGQSQIPREIRGVEVTRIKGWLANIYAWQYIPEWSTVHPMSGLHQPYEMQTPWEMGEQSRLLDFFGSGADVLEYSPNPDSPDHNRWLTTYFENPACTHRPFFLLYEHVNGARFERTREDGRIDMSLAINRQRFEEDLEFMFRNVILPCQARYVTWNRRALIFLWSMGDMIDAAPLLEEMRIKYPVAFVGGVNVLHFPALQGPENMKSLQALDILMEYTLFPVLPTSEEVTAGRISYARMARMHLEGNLQLRFAIGEFEKNTKRKRLLIPTMAYAFDDTNYPRPQNLPMYPESRKEVEDFAQRIKRWMEGGVYTPVGPFVVWNEYFEGGAIAPSQSLPETLDRPGRWVGCGYTRAQITEQYFGKRRW